MYLLNFSVALAQNKTGVTTATAMAAAGGNAPLVPHMRPCATRQHHEWMGHNPPSKWMYFGGRLRVCMALKALLYSGNYESPQQLSVLRAIHTLNSPQNYACLLGGLLPIHLMHRRRAQASCGVLGGHFSW